MATEYTKGSWEVGKYPNGVETHIYCDDATGSAIACADFRYVDRPKEEIAANLRLMAAAPELLEALMGLRKLLWSEGYADQDMDMAKADAAIRKATHE